MEITKIGLGTYQLKPDDAYRIVLEGLKIGYRHIDTAALYKNEEAVGKAIKDSGINRDEIFVTTKIWNDDIKNCRIEEACSEGLKRLNLDYVDLLLLHNPVNVPESWMSMESLVRIGKTRYIGMSNFEISDIKKVLDVCTIKPYTNQIRFTPTIQNKDIVDFCKGNNISITAHSCIRKGVDLNNQELIKRAKNKNLTPAQFILSWCLDKQMIIIPRTTNIDHLKQNFIVPSNILDEEDSQFLDS